MRPEIQVSLYKLKCSTLGKILYSDSENNNSQINIHGHGGVLGQWGTFLHYFSVTICMSKVE